MRNPTLLLLTTLSALLASACAVDVEDTGVLDDVEVEEDNDAIVGGSNQNITDHPWQVSIQSSSGSHFCGGSVLNANWIVTAQHCIEGAASYNVAAPGSMRVAAGASKLSGMNSSGQIRQIEQVIPYPGYSDASLGKDIALIKLSSPLTLNGTTVKAIALATPADASAGLTNAGVSANVSGWGTLRSGGSSPDTLQAVNVPIVSNATASSLYGTTISADQIAAGDTTNGGKDACQGDSGGPFTVAKGSDRILAGVVSWGNGCADRRYPGLYARVSTFESWLNSTSSSTFNQVTNQTGLSGASNSWKHYTVTVPAGAKGLSVYTGRASSSSGDADLFVRRTSQPTTSAYNCRSQESGNNEGCVIPSPASGTWYVSVRGYSSYSGVNLTAYTY
ncbi:trypsin-like serine protease [Chondromyces crocatus]|uniref:Peptidase S1 n=1 Tax=Chondromyces crocatus TaxID=52 RepID=A0A0K1EQC3_CHOCO|nr:trypsin-like serine protease [Chondromyces crocatus]AKT43110.1 peptidase S1 [Chondromyces crocatus]